MKKKRFHLGFLLVLYTIASLVGGGLVFGGVRLGGEWLINEKLYTRESIIEKEKELFTEYISWLNEKRGSLFSRKDGLKWLDDRADIMLAVYNGGSPIGNSDSGVLLISASQDAPAMYELLQTEYADYWYTCPVMTGRDRTRTQLVRVMYYPMYRADRIVLYSSVGAAFAAFVVLLLLFIRVKMRYISYLTNQLAIMEGGELGMAMELKGSDELTSLAANMDRMRLSFIDKLKHEEDMERSRNELMTAMSHDLRTPLTALMGYLEIVDSGTVTDPEKIKEYIASAKRRAKQLKGMTDEMFQYFLVYSGEENAVQLEKMDALMLFTQLWDESGFTLESEGFTVETDISEGGCEIEANPDMMRRVFDNIVSNIRKYADRSDAVRLEMRTADEGFVVKVSNRSAERHTAESSGIGVMTCEKIMQIHGGRFETKMEEGIFTATVIIPAI